MRKPVLLISPFFSPQSHAPAFRVHKLAKYLHQFGWAPQVLTVDCNYNYNEDLGLLSELPEDVPIHRARYIEPSIRGVRMACGGRDRSFRAVKEALADEEISTPGTQATTRSQRAYRFVREHWLEVPDPFWPWVRPAIRLGEQLIRTQRIGAIVTSAPPYSSHLIGLGLKRRAGCRWVADFRDPGTYSRRMSSQIASVFQRQRKIERQALATADVVTTAASSFALIFDDIYGRINRRPFKFIPSGLDEALAECIQPEVAPSSRYLIYVGEILSEYDLSFFDTFAAATRDFRCEGDKVNIVIVGHKQINQRILASLLAADDGSRRVSFVDQLPQVELYRLIKGATAGLIISGEQSHWWTCYAKMADYIALRKRVFAIVPNPSEARTALSRTGLGVFLDGSAELRKEALIHALITPEQSRTSEQETECERYTAHRQVSDFAEVLTSLEV